MDDQCVTRGRGEIAQPRPFPLEAMVIQCGGIPHPLTAEFLSELEKKAAQAGEDPKAPHRA